MTIHSHPAPPTATQPAARVLTLTGEHRFITNPSQTADPGPVLVTTITITEAPKPGLPPRFSLQGQTPTGEFIDLAATLTSEGAKREINRHAPAETQDAVLQATAELYQPATDPAPQVQIHETGPDARAITIPQGFLTPISADTQVRVTTITVQTPATGEGRAVDVTLQGTLHITDPHDQRTYAEEFIDLTGLVSTSDAIARVAMDAPRPVQDALHQVLSELRHPAGKATPPPTAAAAPKVDELLDELRDRRAGAHIIDITRHFPAKTTPADTGTDTTDATVHLRQDATVLRPEDGPVCW